MGMTSTYTGKGASNLLQLQGQVRRYGIHGALISTKGPNHNIIEVPTTQTESRGDEPNADLQMVAESVDYTDRRGDANGATLGL